MRTRNPYGKSVLAGVTAALASIGTAYAGVHVLYTFTGGSDGAYPLAGLVKDKEGNLYGTTYQGGTYGAGTVFKLAPGGTETVLYAFTGRGGDGAYPYSGVIEDKAGNLYGTTLNGGSDGNGTVFKLAPDGTETVLHSFAGEPDGFNPWGGLIQDKAGNLYGTTGEGGTYGYGTVFKLAPDGAETVLYAFRYGDDGAYPLAGLIQDKAGNFYGTTTAGGDRSCSGHSGYGCGTVFKLAPGGAETTLYAFRGRKHRDGATPYAGLTRDDAGSLYGTTTIGGSGCKSKYGCGTVFKVASDGTETVLYSFTGGRDGAYPRAGVTEDKAGNLYGTTSQGGGNGCGGSGCGTVFKLAPDGTETVLYAFRKHEQHRGSLPYAGLIKGGDGQLYGTASGGGGTDCANYTYGCGTVFRLGKQNKGRE